MPVRDLRVALERWRRRARDEGRAHVTPDSVLGSIPAAVQSGQVIPVEEIEMPVIEEDGSIGDRGVGESEETSRFGVRSEWTALRAWSIFGFATCTVPWYMTYDDAKKEYVMKSNWIQKTLCILQHVLSTVDALQSLSYVPSLLSNATPFTFIHISGLLFAIATRLWFVKVLFLSQDEILDYHNLSQEDTLKDETVSEANISRASEARLGTNTNARHSKPSKVIGTTAAFILFALLMIGTDFGMQLKAYDGYWKEGGLPSVIQASACYARKTFLWKDDDNCGLSYIEDKVSDIPTSEKAWSAWGFVTFFNAKMAQYQTFIAINVSIWMFYCDAVKAMWTIQNTNQPAIHSYDNLKTRADILSGFAGILMALQLMEIATNIPGWSETSLMSNVFLSVYIVGMVAGFYSFIILGCYGSLLSEKIKDEVGGSRGQSSRPSTPRQMSAFLFRLIRNNVGIGVPGIFVLNFGFLAAYMSLVGTFIMVLYEVNH